MENYRSFSPVNLAVEALGDKWSLLILRDMIFEGKRYFRELLVSEEKIVSSTLASRLATLEKDGLIMKQADPASKQKTRYSLTQKSVDLLPFIVESIAWSLRYEPVDTRRYQPAVEIALDNDAYEQLRRQLIAGHLAG
ncbi:winged helix-turn-helix transcriptional regulator [Mucilaginibacter celer]|nr:helix-turn-helix domain-containing protein [Mucilaginibacter celer]